MEPLKQEYKAAVDALEGVIGNAGNTKVGTATLIRIVHALGKAHAKTASL